MNVMTNIAPRAFLRKIPAKVYQGDGSFLDIDPYNIKR